MALKDSPEIRAMAESTLPESKATEGSMVYRDLK
jgi:hypothetical protein